jgi:hypothetical protein
MTETITTTTRREQEPYEVIEQLKFEEPPRIANRSDALYLLDSMIGAITMLNFDLALEALRDAIAREII